MNNFQEDPRVAVFITRFIMESKEAILFVYHHEDDGAWEFIGDTPAQNDKDYRLVSLEEIINYDPSILKISELELGKCAYRLSNDEPWVYRD